MKPIISTTGKTTQLRYELPLRAYDSKVYPVKAPNGSTIILYGHETGVGALWRGGRPLKKTTAPPPKQPPKPPKVNGTSTDTIMIIDSDDDAPPAPQALPKADFEEEEEELDPDHPYPSIIQQLRLSLNTQVLHIAVPQIPAISAVRPADSIPAIFSKKIVFAVTCADYSVRVITLPLSPPSDAAKATPFRPKSQWGEEVVKVPTHAGHQSIPRGITMTWTSRSEANFDEGSGDDMNVDADESTTPGRRRARRKQSRSRSGHRAEKGWDLLVASHSTELGGLLKIWRFGLTGTSIAATTPIAAYQTLPLRKLATQVIFNSAQYPKRRHSQLLITDASGNARIYDPFAPRQASRTAGTKPEPGNFIALFRTTFEHTKSNSPTLPVLAARKPILDAAWASDGHHILALLADGEWGIWDVGRTGPSPPSDPSAFSIRGFVVTSESSRSGSGPSSPKIRNGRTSLAPMTPNTRRTKGESLFHGVSTSSSTPNHGGVSVASLPSVVGGASEDSVVIWYGSEVFRISNLEKFLSRTASGNANGGSLPAPGLTPLQGIALHGEAITSVNQLDTTVREARLAIPRDVLIFTDHRVIITVNTTQPLGRDLNAAFAKEQADEAEARKTDQALLARGELDLGGMGRLLEDMEGSGSASGQRSMVIGNPRKVLFASSTT
ncbi:hypothetical protein K505DRAFT_227892 [Melanomma pulvis-pyrius CBS 109.77]|uniref:Nucleoporin NUP37 n=1 Tax=Melanomma pulvis-pyrius CBS 109.77 TaxID=1314802 RepID=A0A6A6XXR1_9PLEO|nr:hypothetical protein K505DRAFT_227892 [Melanomma pulvis-pyrius CBS 109.77]